MTTENTKTYINNDEELGDHVVFTMGEMIKQYKMCGWDEYERDGEMCKMTDEEIESDVLGRDIEELISSSSIAEATKNDTTKIIEIMKIMGIDGDQYYDLETTVFELMDHSVIVINNSDVQTWESQEIEIFVDDIDVNERGIAESFYEYVNNKTVYKAELIENVSNGPSTDLCNKLWDDFCNL